jgi:LuxR family transcriptional regulator, maltose regulon positive regulatory protein
MAASRAGFASGSSAERNRRSLRRRTAADARETPARSPVPPFAVVGSKVRVPSLRSGLVARTALVNRLRATTQPIVLLTAPAGYGKTTVLGQWAGHDSRPFAWLSVDDRDNDPIVLLRHLAVALDVIEPLEQGVLDALAVLKASTWASVVPRLGAALAAFDQPIVVVLDDAHLLRSHEGLDAVRTLTEQGHDGSLLVMAGRSSPKLAVATLRASGRMSEIGVEVLAMRPNESRKMLRAMDAALSDADETELVERCEGWPAALYLAAVALREEQTCEDDHRQTGKFGGEDRHFADYVRSEYLEQLRPGALRFLRRTSVLRSMCGSLCDAVLDSRGSARRLEDLERLNLFLVPLDHQRIWYRYQHLFRELLQRELAECEPELFDLLHSRAADWYERHGEPEFAVEHALSAGDLDRVARIIVASALPMYYGGRIALVERWLSHFDDPVLLERYPGVALQGGWMHAVGGRSAEADSWLQAAEGGTFTGVLPDGCTSLRPWIAVLRAALCRDGAQQMLADAAAGLAGLPPRSLMRPAALLLLGCAYVLLGESKQGDDALRVAAEEAERVEATDTRMVALSQRSLIATARDDPARAEALALEARQLVDHGHVDEYVTSAIALAVAARAALRHGRWEEAHAHLAEAERVRPLLTQGLFPWLTLQAQLELARAYLALGDTRVHSLVREIREMLKSHPRLGALAQEADAVEADVGAMNANGGGPGLTGAELRLLPLLSTHLTFREIGSELFVSRNTIKTQAISVYRKLGVSSRSDAVDRAAELGLVEQTRRAI